MSEAPRHLRRSRCRALSLGLWCDERLSAHHPEDALGGNFQPKNRPCRDALCFGEMPDPRTNAGPFDCHRPEDRTSFQRVPGVPRGITGMSRSSEYLLIALCGFPTALLALDFHTPPPSLAANRCSSSASAVVPRFPRLRSSAAALLCPIAPSCQLLQESLGLPRLQGIELCEILLLRQPD